MEHGNEWCAAWPQKYPQELRERAVRMVLEVRVETGERHGGVTRIAKQLGVGTESLRQWVNQVEVDSGRRPGVSTADAQRIADLEQEVRELRRANDWRVQAVGAPMRMPVSSASSRTAASSGVS